MRRLYKDRLLSTVVVLVMTAVLVTLAMLQYRWSNEISRATSERMEVDLESTIMRFRDDLYREVAGFSFALHVDTEAKPADRLKEYSRQYEAWSRSAEHASVVKSLYVLEPGESGRLLQRDPATSDFRSAHEPQNFGPLLSRLRSISTEVAVAATHLKSTEELRQQRSKGEELAKQFPVLVDEDLPALAQPVYRKMASASSHADPSAIEWVIVELDNKVLREHIIPELLARHFGFGKSQRTAYEVAVIDEPGPDIVYTSDAGFPKKGKIEFDEKIRVFGPPMGPTLRGIDMILLPAYHTQDADGRFHENNDIASTWPVRIEPIHYTTEDDDWYVIARHRRGSLDAAVAYMRRRDLAVSFTVLLLLAATMIMLYVSSRRAQSLARLQMDFVAGVSHELRTPLAVICSAADNIADGVVGGREQMKQYGGVIKNSARQLIHLVEQVMTFASTYNKRYPYNMAPLTPEEIVETAYGNVAELAQAAGVTVERRIDAGLPAVIADRAAVAHCLQNLITNAIKYGGEARWVGIRACLVERGGNKEIQISVEDRGMGIAPAELRHIFEPFYRSPAVVAAQIRGTGLGLSLANSIAQAMGGKLTVTSEQGKGSCFVLHLPVSRTAIKSSEVELTAPVKA
ncbi:MAG TPA: HAMP domain-containing sensor histidine kinase [Candidatus Angelobacter sp.]|jgi:signal transduction histidine kinase|nr:HAMP domain-containing sensor histidine kinase [Candidatus Angelobacter sp.]